MFPTLISFALEQENKLVKIGFVDAVTGQGMGVFVMPYLNLKKIIDELDKIIVEGTKPAKQVVDEFLSSLSKGGGA